MKDNDVLECVYLISSLLPKLREVLGLTQKDFASTIGISRQTLIDLEHQNKKITRPVLISIISYFSLRCSTAKILFENRLYDNNFVCVDIGFTLNSISNLHGFK